VSIADFTVLDPEELGDSGCFSLTNSSGCNWASALAPDGSGCGLVNGSAAASGGDTQVRCAFGNLTLGSRTRWGLSLIQVNDLTVVREVSSGRRGLLSVLGSIGGAYQILWVAQLALGSGGR
jgi:hypothetical protein